MVLIVHEDGILVFERKGQTPICAHHDRPMILESSSQRVKLPSRSVHVTGASGVFQRKQLKAQLAGVLWLNSRFRPGTEKPLQAPVPEALDHSVKYNDTCYTCQDSTSRHNKEGQESAGNRVPIRCLRHELHQVVSDALGCVARYFALIQIIPQQRADAQCFNRAQISHDL
jgi:hypothetical protein